LAEPNGLPLRHPLFRIANFLLPWGEGGRRPDEGFVGVRLFRFFAAGAAAALVACSAQARVNLVTLPDRDSVQLTVYNSVDLTMVKETRVLTFRKGLNRLEFSWANTLIDPTSVEFRARTHADDVEVMDVSFPPRVTNTLEWRIQSEFAGEVEVEIRYFTSGISWAADYTAEADAQEKLMKLAGRVRVSNNSGEDYENAQVRLIVGVIKLVENIADLAKSEFLTEERFGRRELKDGDEGSVRKFKVMALSRAVDSLEKVGKKREIVKESLSEYFMYTVEGRDTIPNGWSKMLPSFEASDVPIVSFYKYEKERWNDGVMRYYRFKNDVASKLGKEPLPDGDVKALRVVDADSRYAFVGRTAVKYIPVNEQVDLELGLDSEIRVKPTLMDWEKADIQFNSRGDVKGWTIRETWQIEAGNSTKIDALIDIRRNFKGDWSLETDAPYEKVDASKVKFAIPLKSGEKRMIQYKLTTRFGSSVSK
jgi:hypothetical protein